jgi:hypothetical protein
LVMQIKQHTFMHQQLEVKDTTDTQSSAWLHLQISNGGRLKTKFCDKRDDFIFPIVNFPFISSNIPVSPVYGVYISQLIRDSRACAQQIDFLRGWMQVLVKDKQFLLLIRYTPCYLYIQ